MGQRRQSVYAVTMSPKPQLQVAVVIDRIEAPTQWEAWRFRVADVIPDQGQFGNTPRRLRADGPHARFLHPGHTLTLHRDEAQGYYLNLSSGAPVCFVMWRVAEDDPSRAWPELVTLSYEEAGRLLDAQERVDNVPLAPEWVEWLAAFTAEHYRPQPRQRKRPASFQAPAQR